MDEDMPRLMLTSDGNRQVALACGLFGAFVGYTAYLLTKEIMNQSLRDVNRMIEERFVVTDQNRQN